MALPTEPFALTPGDIPTEPLPLVRRTPVAVNPEHRPTPPLSPTGRNDYEASLAGTAAAPGSTPPDGAAGTDDGCCP
jgi:hypothetical protein